MYEEMAPGGESRPVPSHDLLVRYRNPGASADLVIPFVLGCNTPDETVAAHIAANSAETSRVWLRQEPAHHGVAVICGSGPSLVDDLDGIRRLQKRGTIFALNGAAGFLARRGIGADIQFIIDARPENVALIGPAHDHVFAAQVDPALFEAMPDAVLVQIESGVTLPDRAEEYCTLGAHSTVGNVALTLAYAMGFREMHLFGYDSSHRDGESHAFRQKMNDGDPLVYVERGGVRYLTSFGMRQQARVFPRLAHQLRALGCEIHVYGSGLLPDAWNDEPMSEREKYRKLWAMPEYRVVAPGEDCVAEFLGIAAPTGRVIDFGCGTGRAARALMEHGLYVTLIDFAENCRDEEVVAAGAPFFQCDLTERIPTIADYGFCTDVMEHIPRDDTRKVLANIFAAAPRVYFQIDTQPDERGALIGEVLHVNLRPHDEWRAILREFGEIAYERETSHNSVFYVEAP